MGPPRGFQVGNPSFKMKKKRMQDTVKIDWNYRRVKPIFGPTWMGRTTRICIFLWFQTFFMKSEFEPIAPP